MRPKIAITVAFALALALSLPCLAQTTQIFVVNPAGVAAHPEFYSTIQAAINDGVSLSRVGIHVEIHVFRQGDPLGIEVDAKGIPGRSYNENLLIPADADIGLFAVPRNKPWRVTIDGSSGGGSATNATVTIDATLPRVLGAPTDRIILDGFQITGGKHGVVMRGDAGTGDPTAAVGARFAPIISRCYIRKNTTHGVVVGDENESPPIAPSDAQPLLVNCSIVENGDSGVFVNTTHTESDRMPDILFCSIIMNGHRGVYVKDTQNARVRNTLVYRNGPEQRGAFVNPNDGGLVWASDLFIVPDFGKVQGGETANIFGTNIGDVTTTDVYFGPPSIPGTMWTKLPLSAAGAAAGAALEGTVPSAYLGVPGPVPVHIVSTGGPSAQPFSITVPDGYRYISDNTSTGTDDDENRPAITLVLPQNGPPEGQNWVRVFGVNFDSNCRVGFDFDPAGSLPGVTPVVAPGDGVISRSPNDEQSPRVIWMSSGELLVKVPENPYITPLLPNQKVDVIVENLDSNLSSVPPSPRTDPMKDYEYRLKDAAIDMTIPYAWQPNIVQVVPNFCRTPEGNMKVSIVGWDFECNALVKIGNIICPYTGVTKGTPFPPTSPAYPHTFDEIEEVVVPVAEFGTGGSYDVEVINPTGHHDILVNGFTYYSDGVPRLDPSPFKWRPANFRLYDVSTTLPSDIRRLLGTDFDTGISVTFDPPAFDPADPAAKAPPFGNDIDNVLIQEARQQHERHSQREVVFSMPPAQNLTHSPTPFPDDFLFPIASRTVPVQIWNRSGTDGSSTIATTADDTKNTEVTHFVWATDPAIAPVGPGEGLYFEVRNIQQICAAAVIYADVYNWQGVRAVGAGNGMDVFVENTLVNAGVTTGTTSGGVTTITIDLSLVTLPHGLAGPVDLTVVLPDGQPSNNSGEDLYFVVEDAFFLEPPGPTCLPNDHAWQIYGRAIEPRAVPAVPPAPPAVPDAQPIEVHIFGSFFHGPAFGGTGGQGIWTNAIIVDPATGIPTWPISALAPSSYKVVSSEEIVFEAFDVTAATITPAIPLDTQLDVLLQNECSGVPVGPTDTMTGAILFSTRLVPDITDVYVPPAPSDRRWGTVEGGTDLTVVGHNFHPTLTGASKVYEPRVRINGVAARTFTAFSDTMVTIGTPPAPYGLPATYPVSVITRMTVLGQDWVFEAMAPEDLWFTYVMDGAPHISDVSPNHVDADAAGKGNVYFTITGSNFDDEVELLIDANPADHDGAEILPGPTFFSISPFEVVAVAPSPADLGEHLTFGPGDVATTMIYVKNGAGSSDIETNPDHLISNGVTLFYYRGNQGLQPRTPQLGFNDAYLNYRDYVNAAPGPGSISVDPLLDPGQDAGLPGPIMKILRATASDWWLGKLALISQIYASYSQYWNPLCEKAAEIDLAPFTDEDLELESRPQPAPGAQGTGPTAPAALPDIGADEILSAAAYGDVAWYYAWVSPDPAGAVPAGGLYVEAAIRGDAIDPDYPPIFFYLPQGVLPPDAGDDFDTWLDDHDYLQLDVLDEGSYIEGGDAFYAMTNASAITTVLDDRDGSGTATSGDIIADGHAAVFMAVDIDGNGAIDLPNEIVGYDPGNPGDLSDGEFIRDQAVAGRHFLIDTIPPRIHVETYTTRPDPNPLLNAIVAADLIYAHNDLYTAGTFWAPLALPAAYTSPYWVPPPDGLAAPMSLLTPGDPLTRWDPAIVDAPEDYLGEIRFDTPPLAADANVGAQIFFNVASAVGLYQNDPDLDNLQLGVRVRFIDPPVIDAETGDALDIADIFLPALILRQVAGFPDDPRHPDPVDALLPGSLESGSAHWVFVEGRRFLVDPRIPVASGFLVDGTSEGFVPWEGGATTPSLLSEEERASLREEGYLFENEQLSATWTFDDPATERIEGIDWKLAYDSVFHVVAQFIAQDAAGNVTAGPETVLTDSLGDPADVSGIPDPLQIWWLINVQTKFTPNLEGRTLVDPSIQWVLNRETNPVVRSSPDPSTIPAGPRPIYTFRLWVADEYGGPYEPLTVWEDWTLYPTDPDTHAIMPASTDIMEYLTGLGILDDAMDRWLLILVISADEAGNVEPWPSDGLSRDPDTDNVSVSASNGVNWMRFYLGGEGLPDTKVEAEFWYDKDGNRTSDPGETNLGSARRVPVQTPTPIKAGFTLGVIPGEGETIDDIEVQWELLKDGGLVASGTKTYAELLATRRNQVVLPDDGMTGVFEDFATGAKQAQYLFWAQAVDITRGIEDPSPATYSFIVTEEVPQADRFNRLDTEDTQSIKIQEEK